MSGGKDKSVQVTDGDLHFLEPTRPAKARKLVDSGKAELVEKNPPMIKLNRTIDVERGKKKMTTERTMSINEYFKQNEEVYIQNIFGGVVSLTFKDRDDNIPFTLPNKRVPIRLTDYIQKEIIMRSSDFRRFLMRKPPAIRLLTEEEYNKSIGRVAKETGKSEAEVIANASDAINKFQAKAEKVTEPTKPFDPEAPKTEEDDATSGLRAIDVPGELVDGVNPRAMQIVSNCAMDAENRMTAEDALEELAVIDLDTETLNYIAGAMSYKTIRTWAQKKLISDTPVEDDEPADANEKGDLSPSQVEDNA